VLARKAKQYEDGCGSQTKVGFAAMSSLDKRHGDDGVKQSTRVAHSFRERVERNRKKGQGLETKIPKKHEPIFTIPLQQHEKVSHVHLTSPKEPEKKEGHDHERRGHAVHDKLLLDGALIHIGQNTARSIGHATDIADSTVRPH
jgi:hypothetical protein